MSNLQKQCCVSLFVFMVITSVCAQKTTDPTVSFPNPHTDDSICELIVMKKSKFTKGQRSEESNE